ncbi:MAG: type II toxin-antitoxin system RatA family toxin [Rhodospirillaceae bacterium]|nr:type II toxin-antitoxin system RatA family toxin [Rhodospirillaceae bacterium]
MPAHRLHRDLPYSPDQLFQLVADVERYPDFVPWWAAARVRRREGDRVYYTDQVIRMGPMTQRFTSRTEMEPSHKIHVSATEKPFDRLAIDWAFTPSAAGCAVDLSLEFLFKSATLARMLALVSGEAAHTLMKAFEHRAHSLFGTPQLGLDGIGHAH